MNNKVQRTHLERRAVVYLRQSTMRQVYEHQESTSRQYSLRQRAIDMGWTADAVQVVDVDLGQSGTSTERREGFQRLAEDVAHGRIGAVFALEASRLARSSADWHRLLDLCGLADVLIGDELGVYAPRDPNDRLVLGLKGQMSEAEQYWMRLRLQGGKLSKARRGELYLQPPAGYVWDDHTSRLRLDPDEQVRRGIALIFERFRLDGSAHGVVRYFARKGVLMPARDAVTGALKWRRLTFGVVYAILRNPLYTGTYVYGRREERRGLVDGEIRRRRVKLLPQEEWKAFLPEHHPAYIGWEEYMTNQEKLHANSTDHDHPDRRGAAREGAALLQGLAICGRCGHRMGVGYREGKPHYVCQAPGRATGLGGHCWSVSGRFVEPAVTDLFLRAAQPPELELSLAVAREADRQAGEIELQWRLRLDRVEYEAKLAERRYMAVDPENRVVARTLEREWEEKLRAVEATEREYGEVRRREKVELTEQDRAHILALARDLPAVWRAPTTSLVQRKNLLRMLVKEVTLLPVDIPRRQTRVQVLWETGAVTEIFVPRPDRKAARAASHEAEDQVRTMIEAGQPSEAVVKVLNERGLKTGSGRRWDVQAVWRVKRRLGLRRPAPPAPIPKQRADGMLSTRGIAARFDVTVAMVHYWIAKGWVVPAAGGGQGVPWRFNLDEDTIQSIERAIGRGHGPNGLGSKSEG